MSRRVVCVRHAMPAVDKSVSSRLWPLTQQGREAAERLAKRLRLPKDVRVVSSDEVKAKETAAAFSVPVNVDSRLREVVRPWIDGDYKSAVRSWLRGDPVESWESRDAVVTRMTEAIEEGLEKTRGTLVVVAHGLAMSAYAAEKADLDPMRFWSALEFPDVRIVDLEQGRIEEPGAEQKRRVEVVRYDPSWPSAFEKIANDLLTLLGSRAVHIEHVGSTAVSGISAKPIIDIDVAIESSDEFAEMRDRLEEAGYRWEGDLGVEGREAFRRPPGTRPHHLYVCAEGARPLDEHIAFRDYLRSHPEVSAEYSRLKEQLAVRYSDDHDGYTDAKTEFVRDVLDRTGRQAD